MKEKREGGFRRDLVKKNAEEKNREAKDYIGGEYGWGSLEAFSFGFRVLPPPSFLSFFDLPNIGKTEYFVLERKMTKHSGSLFVWRESKSAIEMRSSAPDLF